ncbi:MAG: hypothetical protein Q8R39_03785 [bacterium]|nr:hypothetical protein [bacterium]MDZ4284375.1 hypothetical protein [Patescibacteria group bacterium]
MTASNENLFLSVRIASAEGVIWEGTANSISSVNHDGPFDVLPQHAQFITLVSNAPVTVRPVSGVAETFTFRSAVMHVYSNTVAVYVGI